MVVQPTSVAYSFLMECPIPSTESESRDQRKETETKKLTDKKKIHTQRKSTYVAR